MTVRTSSNQLALKQIVQEQTYSFTKNFISKFLLKMI